MTNIVDSPPWVADNEYDSGLPPTTQVVTQITPADTIITYYVNIENDGTGLDTFTVTGTASAGGWFVTYYNITGTNITSDIIGTGKNIGPLNIAGSDKIYLEPVGAPPIRVG